MKDLFKVIRTIASEINDAIVMFSTGKDSIVTLDLCCKFIKNIKVVHLYFVKDLSYRDRFLKYYEDRYSVKIDKYPQVDVSRIFSNKAFTNNIKDVPKLKQVDMELYLRKEYNMSYLAYGYRKDESLQRRGHLTSCNAFEKKFKRFFPVADWSQKDIFNYIKKEKLPLPVEYSFGFRDINFFEGEGLMWLYRNYPEDYEKMKLQYPFIGAELLRAKQ